MSTEIKPQDSHHDENMNEKIQDSPVEQGSTKGDLGGQFMASYTGPRHEITDEDSTRVRWKIDKYLLPM